LHHRQRPRKNAGFPQKNPILWLSTSLRLSKARFKILDSRYKFSAEPCGLKSPDVSEHHNHRFKGIFPEIYLPRLREVLNISFKSLLIFGLHPFERIISRAQGHIRLRKPPSQHRAAMTRLSWAMGLLMLLAIQPSLAEAYEIAVTHPVRNLHDIAASISPPWIDQSFLLSPPKCVLTSLTINCPYDSTVRAFSSDQLVDLRYLCTNNINGDRCSDCSSLQLRAEYLI
jgi:hypothetical protein